MTTVEQAAKLFGINQRRIFQIIETGTVHFSETDSGATLICIASMSNESGQVQSDAVEVGDDGRDQQKDMIADTE